jgi:hypothetical protein
MTVTDLTSRFCVNYTCNILGQYSEYREKKRYFSSSSEKSGICIDNFLSYKINVFSYQQPGLKMTTLYGTIIFSNIELGFVCKMV